MEEVSTHLSQDKVLASLIKRYSLKPLTLSSDLFSDLVKAILSQQLSNKAASTIINRFLALFSDSSLNPQEILLISDDKLKAVGISRQKISYLKNLSENISLGALVIDSLQELPDEEVITKLTQVKGIGRWTAEMFLIFSLGRQDVFSLGDLGLRSAVSHLYGIGREERAAMEIISRKWSPYRSYASLMLWRSLENESKVATPS
jgi:DNA-3-methyladenine glycosylase II